MAVRLVKTTEAVVQTQFFLPLLQLAVVAVQHLIALVVVAVLQVALAVAECIQQVTEVLELRVKDLLAVLGVLAVKVAEVVVVLALLAHHQRFLHFLLAAMVVLELALRLLGQEFFMLAAVEQVAQILAVLPFLPD
jgi:hypothetical protein